MNFYTNVSRYGNMLLYRGIENGKRVQKKIKNYGIEALIVGAYSSWPVEG